MRRSGFAYVVACALLVASTACGKHATHDEPPPPPLDRSTIYPLIVPANDLASGPVRRPLIDGLVVTLAAEVHGADPPGQAKLLREVDLPGMSLDEAYTAALANLEAAARRGEIQVKAEVGSAGRPVDVVWGHDWRAAACLLLPGVRQQAAQQLLPPRLSESANAAAGSASASGSATASGSAAISGSATASGSATTSGSATVAAPSGSTPVYAVIPNRDVLVFFADPAVAGAALAAEKGAPRPISDRVLRVLPSDQPFWIQPPIAPAN